MKCGSRHYEAQLRAVLRTHPAVRGIGIDETTAIVVTVLGRARTVLTKGQRFDLRGSLD